MPPASPRTRILSVGGNAVSAFLSWRLQATNACDVTLVWKNGFDHVSQYGISFRSRLYGNERFKPHSVVAAPQDAAKKRQPFDYIILCVKALPDVYDISSVIEAVVTPQHTCILVNNSNSMGIESYLEQRFPSNLILSLVSGADVVQLGPSDFEHRGSTTHIWVGPANENSSISPAIQSDMAESLSMTLASGQVDCRVSSNILQQQFEVMIGHIAFHPASVIFETPNHADLVEKVGARATIAGVIDELIAVASAVGCTFPPDFAETTFESMIKSTENDNYSVMYLDYQAKRPLEVEGFLGAPLKLAIQRHVSVPRIESLYSILHHINIVNQSRPKPQPQQLLPHHQQQQHQHPQQNFHHPHQHQQHQPQSQQPQHLLHLASPVSNNPMGPPPPRMSSVPSKPPLPLNHNYPRNPIRHPRMRQSSLNAGIPQSSHISPIPGGGSGPPPSLLSNSSSAYGGGIVPTPGSHANQPVGMINSASTDQNHPSSMSHNSNYPNNSTSNTTPPLNPSSSSSSSSSALLLLPSQPVLNVVSAASSSSTNNSAPPSSAASPPNSTAHQNHQFQSIPPQSSNATPTNSASTPSLIHPSLHPSSNPAVLNSSIGTYNSPNAGAGAGTNINPVANMPPSAASNVMRRGTPSHISHPSHRGPHPSAPPPNSIYHHHHLNYDQPQPPPLNKAHSFDNDLEEFSHLVLYENTDDAIEGPVNIPFDNNSTAPQMLPNNHPSSDLALRERELMIRQRELYLREQELNMRYSNSASNHHHHSHHNHHHHHHHRRPHLDSGPPYDDEDDDDDDDEQAYYDSPSGAASLGMIHDSDNFDMLSITSRRTRKTASAHQLRKMEITQGGRSRKPFIPGLPKPARSNRVGTRMVAEIPGLHDSIMDDALMGYSSNRYGDVDRSVMHHGSRTNSVAMLNMAGPG